ncbi:MAG: hypothetical protein HC771_17685 [Synechococcales cyanobacterium CRU_2_2]|nr:hypothetical protein [Synechococcales cyanobacterium CRU_2_2]
MKPSKATISALFAWVAVSSATVVAAQTPVLDSAKTPVLAPVRQTVAPVAIVHREITEREVLAAQQAWGNALVAISTTYDQKGLVSAKSLAGDVIDRNRPRNLTKV